MSNLYIAGTAYTPVREKDYQGGCFREHEMTDDLAQRCIGLPVLVNHDWNHPPVGKVKDAYIDEEKNLQVVLDCDVPAFNEYIYGCLTDNNVKNEPIFRGLSMGKGHKEVRQNYDINIVDKEPREISIVRVGDRPGTWIKDFEMF